MTGVIQGKDAMIYFKTGDGFKLYGCATEFGLSTDTELKSVKTKGDGAWKKNAPQSLSYSITLNGLLKFDDNVDGWYLIDGQINFIGLAYRIIFISGSQVKRIDGEVLVQNSQISAVPSDVVKANFTLPGNGPYQLFNNDGTCASVITDATLVNGVDSHLSFAANADTAYISYSLFRFDTLIDAGTAYAPDFNAVVSGFGPVNLYRVEATPYCSNDVAGTPFTKHF